METLVVRPFFNIFIFETASLLPNRVTRSANTHSTGNKFLYPVVTTICLSSFSTSINCICTVSVIILVGILMDSFLSLSRIPSLPPSPHTYQASHHYHGIVIAHGHTGTVFLGVQQQQPLSPQFLTYHTLTFNPFPSIPSLSLLFSCWWVVDGCVTRGNPLY